MLGCLLACLLTYLMPTCLAGAKNALRCRKGTSTCINTHTQSNGIRAESFIHSLIYYMEMINSSLFETSVCVYYIIIIIITTLDPYLYMYGNRALIKDL